MERIPTAELQGEQTKKEGTLKRSSALVALRLVRLPHRVVWRAIRFRPERAAHDDPEPAELAKPIDVTFP